MPFLRSARPPVPGDAALFGSLVDLVLPRRCAGCRDGPGLLCSRCLPDALPFEAPVAAGVPVVAAGGYDGGLRRAVIAYKERGRRDLAAVLARLLGSAVRVSVSGSCGPGRPALVAPPASRDVRAERGGDHVLRLARGAVRGMGRDGPVDVVPDVVPDVLRRDRGVRDSAGLGAADRERNLSGAFRARPPDARHRVAIVVDDVVTTGATVREATRALTAAGWQVTGAAVVAATPRRFFGNPLAAPGERV